MADQDIRFFGSVPKKGKWEEMWKIYHSCRKMDVLVPQEVISYFNGCEPGYCREIEATEKGECIHICMKDGVMYIEPAARMHAERYFELKHAAEKYLES